MNFNAETNVKSASSNEEKENYLHQLLCLLHADECLRSPTGKPCTILHCKPINGLMSHISNCEDYPSCHVSHCNSSMEIILHWKECFGGQQCVICDPLCQKIQKLNKYTDHKDTLKLKNWRPSFTTFTRVVRIWNVVESIFFGSKVEKEDKVLAEQVVLEMERKILQEAKDEEEYIALMDGIVAMYKQVEEEDERERAEE